MLTPPPPRLREYCGREDRKNTGLEREEENCVKLSSSQDIANMIIPSWQLWIPSQDQGS